jgi:predicted dehydrogenase
MRIAVIGARRCRNGIGAHLARFLVAAGADVVGLLGTTPATAADAAAQLEAATGHRARAHVDADALIASERPDALVIASPHETHAAFLELALAHQLHAFCDKPLLWGGADPAGRARSLGARFLAARRHLVVNTQWPRTLPTYDALHPGARDRPRRFWMRMSPPSGRPLDMLLEAMPHPLSLLHAAVGSGAVEEVRFERLSGHGDASALRATFAYVAASGPVDCVVDLVEAPRQPRAAGYGFDARVVHRELELPGYALFLRTDDGRRVPLPDPTPLHVRSFLDAVASGPPAAVDPGVDPGMEQLARICNAYDATRAPRR